MNDKTFEAPRHIEEINQELVDELYASVARLAETTSSANAVRESTFNIDFETSEVTEVSHLGPDTVSFAAHTVDGAHNPIHLAAVTFGDIYDAQYLKFTFAKARNEDGTHGPKIEAPRFHEKINGVVDNGYADVDQLTILVQAIDLIERQQND